MTFLQPLILYALPLIGLPILIHFVNQNRHRTVHWAATMFLLQARKMATGMARLRYLLIMLARMLVIAGLVFAVSRPMSGGWLGVTVGGAADTVIVVLDRSASMEEQDAGSNESKRQVALRKLSDLMQNAGTSSQLVLFDSATGQPLKLESAVNLTDLPEIEGTATTADIPALLQSVAEYIATNQTGRTDIWVCSDLRQNDWNPDGGRWPVIRRQLEGREGIRFYLLSYTELAPENLAVSVSGVHRRVTEDGAELVMDLKITRQAASNDPVRVPVTFVIDGARSTQEVEITGTQLLKNGHLIPLDREATSGWGRVELPADANSSDNSYGFVYAESAVQRTTIISDQPAVAQYLRIAAATSSTRGINCVAEVLSSTQAAAIPWKESAMIIWQAPLPTGVIASQLSEFAASGRSILFFPPELPDGNSAFGFRWTSWESAPGDKPLAVTRWRTDADVLANSQSGTPLPAGQLDIHQVCSVESTVAASSASSAAEGSAVAGNESSGDASELPSASVLAQLDNRRGLLTRVLTEQGAVYFCSTIPVPSHSSLVSNGVVFYVMIQRALAQGAGALGQARNLECGSLASQAANNWKPVDDLTAAVMVSRRSLMPGIFAGDETLFAINRPLAEDTGSVLSDEVLQSIFGELDYTIINDQTDSGSELASEIWRAFLILMIVALLAEALLCVPERSEKVLSPIRSASVS